MRVPPPKKLYGGIVPPPKKLFGGIVPTNKFFGRGTVPPNSFILYYKHSCKGENEDVQNFGNFEPP